MSGTQTVQMQPPNENMATSIEHLHTKENHQDNKMVKNIMDSYQDMEIQENEDDNPEEIYNRRMMEDINEPPDQNHMEMVEEPVQQNIQPVVKKKTMVNSLMDSIKGALIVMALFFVLNQSFIIDTINSVIIKQLGEESSYNMFGLIFRSVLSAILFYALNFFS